MTEKGEGHKRKTSRATLTIFVSPSGRRMLRRGPLWPRDSVPERERSSVATEFAKKLRE